MTDWETAAKLRSEHIERLTRERDEARAEVERLRAGLRSLLLLTGPALADQVERRVRGLLGEGDERA